MAKSLLFETQNFISLTSLINSFMTFLIKTFCEAYVAEFYITYPIYIHFGN